MKLISWNVNGLRAVLKKGFLEFLNAEDPDMICLQETKAQPEQVEPFWGEKYHAFWNSAERKGYSGVLTLTRHEPLRVMTGIAMEEHDREGRVLVTEFEDFQLINVYVPNAQRELARLPYRQTWDQAFADYIRSLEKRKPVIVCGDFNVAHTELDLARPKGNERTHGFTIEERTGLQRILDIGLLDSFREFEKSGGHYTWWSVMNQSRPRNIGWRIDYFLVSQQLKEQLRTAKIRPEIMGSDHCPVEIALG